MQADVDQSQFLSCKEVFFFSLAMSIDSLIAETMVAFLKLSIPLCMAMAFFVDTIFTFFCLYLGEKINAHYSKDLSWISSILFLILAVFKR